MGDCLQGPHGLSRRPIAGGDLAALESCLRRTDLFSDREARVALEVFRTAAGGDTDYVTEGLFEGDGDLAAAICFGSAALSEGTGLIYWVLVDPSWRRRGLAGFLVSSAEAQMSRQGCRMIVVETSGREAYAGTRAFWMSCGFEEEARIADFYRTGDPVVFYVKRRE